MRRLLHGPRLLGALLVLSLAVNLFLSGWTASALWGRPPMPPHGLIERIAGQLSPADAAILRQAFAPVSDPAADARGLHARVDAALRAEPFDRDALVAALRQEADGREAFGRRLADAFLRAAAQLSSDGRRILADALRRGPGPR